MHSVRSHTLSVSQSISICLFVLLVISALSMRLPEAIGSWLIAPSHSQTHFHLSACTHSKLAQTIINDQWQVSWFALYDHERSALLISHSSLSLSTTHNAPTTDERIGALRIPMDADQLAQQHVCLLAVLDADLDTHALSCSSLLLRHNELQLCSNQSSSTQALTKCFDSSTVDQNASSSSMALNTRILALTHYTASQLDALVKHHVATLPSIAQLYRSSAFLCMSPTLHSPTKHDDHTTSMTMHFSSTNNNPNNNNNNNPNNNATAIAVSLSDVQQQQQQLVAVFGVDLLSLPQQQHLASSSALVARRCSNLAHNQQHYQPLCQSFASAVGSVFYIVTSCLSHISNAVQWLYNLFDICHGCSHSTQQQAPPQQSNSNVDADACRSTCTIDATDAVNASICHWYLDPKLDTWLPRPYANAASCACNGNVDNKHAWESASAQCVRAKLLRFHQHFDATMQQSLANYISHAPSCSTTQQHLNAYLQNVFAPYVHRVHIDAYRTCCCPGAPAAIWAWKALSVCWQPWMCPLIPLLIKYFGACACQGW
jgi:hypothetical protein